MRISTTRIVLILIAFTACVGFFVGKLEGKDFMSLALMVFSFYYAHKGYESSGSPTPAPKSPEQPE